MPTVILRSRDRDEGTANDFVIRSQMLLPAGQYRLKHVVMPAAVFTFGPTNCKFKFTFSGTTGIATVEHGFYDGHSAAAVLHAAVNAAHGQGAVSISFDPIKGRIKIETNAAFVVHGSDDVPNSCMKQFGFPDTTTVSGEGHAPGLLDLTNGYSYHIVVNDEGSITNLRTGGHTSFYVVNSDVDNLQLFKFDRRNFGQSLRLHRPSRNLHVELFDGDYRPLLLQAGAEWELVLEF